MRIILYTWGSNSDDMLRRNLINLDYEVEVFARKCEHYTKDLKFAQELINLVHDTDAQGVISFDYFPIISMVCNTVGIPYFSWIYDSPHYTLLAKTTMYECNHIGCFDKALTKRFNEKGINTVRHLPLGVDWNNMDAGNDDSNKYCCDVSFVGSLYSGKYDYFDCIDNPLFKKVAEKVVRSQCFNYWHDHTGEFFADEDNKATLVEQAKEILEREKLLPGDEYIEDIEYIFESAFLDKRVTVEERRSLLKKVAGIGCDFRLYTGSDLKNEPILNKAYKGLVDYNREMPLVFKNSRINLNITLRSIKTGIPLRALDIMGCGGFLLSDYREELAECFEEGREMVIFRGLEDCMDKIKYYLVHDDERKAIAAAGKEAVRNRFDCKEQVRKLLA